MEHPLSATTCTTFLNTKEQGLVQKTDQQTVQVMRPRRLGGFSLVGMMVGMGILSALILGFMELMRGSLTGQQKLMEVREVGDLKNEMGILLDSEKHCRNSLAGSGVFGNPDERERLVFKKTDIDTEGSKELELWTSDQLGNARVEKMFYAGKEYGTLTIESIKLFMDGATEGDYEQSDGHEDIGTLKVKVKNLDKQAQSFNIKLSVFMKTDEHRESTLLSCSRESSTKRCGDKQKWTPNCGCVEKGEAYTRAIEGIGEDSFTCKSLKCGDNQEWHDKCGCIVKQELVTNGSSRFNENTCQYCDRRYSTRCGKCVPHCHSERIYIDHPGTRGGWEDFPTCGCLPLGNPIKGSADPNE